MCEFVAWGLEMVESVVYFAGLLVDTSANK
jgi:hypothetical protein